jgi:hypothetical protein
VKTAVITFTYNEAVNLPIWIRYYGANFGTHNLYIADRGSTDGSIDNPGGANVIRLPRNEFDEQEKTSFISNFHRSLLNFYDTVIITDCDELIVPDPDLFSNLREYVDALEDEYVNCIGLDVVHILDREVPLDLEAPILSQRSFARFHTPQCKPLISRVSITWLPGFHSCNKQPKFDSRLFLFHTKFMDYGIAMARQRINQQTIWSERSLAVNFGAHHRFDYRQFFHQGFLTPMSVVNRGEVGQFTFDRELQAILAETTTDGGFFRIPMKQPHSKIVGIPERFREIL